ncbi:biopolymer transporter ExbD [Longitalea luteola]|uniref:biopolymer transporter ExbD n=1 Tax=Longitalea luteola TaxID=2812563 RepID=UPI001A956BBA|nr:biopolymer transporter ExbD [Longitalea luteola]
MSEINIPGATGDKPGVRRSKKLSTRVDLTPMVDLGFLLITFFIFTTTISDPRVTDLIMPKDSKDSTNVGLSNALTVIPLKEDKVFYYHGELTDALKGSCYGITNYSIREGLGEIVRKKQAALDRVKPGNRKELLLMIKPTPESNYQNLINVLDEVMINGVKRYAIMDITSYEQEVAVNKSSGK